MGSAAVGMLLGRGADVVAVDVKDGNTGGGCTFVKSDLLSTPDLTKLREVLGARGLDCAIVAHGIAGAGPLASHSAEAIERVLSVNFLSVTRLFDAVAENLAAANGAFVIISSQAGLVGEANQSLYCASKFALVGWARMAARRVADRRIRMRVLCPGPTETTLLDSALRGMAAGLGITPEDLAARWLSSIPVGHFGQPSDLAASAIALADLQSPAFIVAAVTGGQVLR
jgi:2-keto-3-deoxy-L-fuconate dehydrogenase